MPVVFVSCVCVHHPGMSNSNDSCACAAARIAVVRNFSQIWMAQCIQYGPNPGLPKTVTGGVNTVLATVVGVLCFGSQLVRKRQPAAVSSPLPPPLVVGVALMRGLPRVAVDAELRGHGKCDLRDLPLRP